MRAAAQAEAQVQAQARVAQQAQQQQQQAQAQQQAHYAQQQQGPRQQYTQAQAQQQVQVQVQVHLADWRQQAHAHLLGLHAPNSQNQPSYSLLGEGGFHLAHPAPLRPVYQAIGSPPGMPVFLSHSHVAGWGDGEQRVVHPYLQQAQAQYLQTLPSTVGLPFPQAILTAGESPTLPETGTLKKNNYKCGKCGQPKRNHLCQMDIAPPATRPALPSNVPANSKAPMTKPVWTRTEDQHIIEGVRQLGPKWNMVALQMPGRSSHAVRNRWHRLQRFHPEQNLIGLEAEAGAMPGVIGFGMAGGNNDGPSVGDDDDEVDESEDDEPGAELELCQPVSDTPLLRAGSGDATQQQPRTENGSPSSAPKLFRTENKGAVKDIMQSKGDGAKELSSLLRAR